MRAGLVAASLVLIASLAGAVGTDSSAPLLTGKMAATVRTEWPAGVISTVKAPGTWAYEEGVLLDGMLAVWQSSSDAADFNYVKVALDRSIGPDGTINGYRADEHTLDDIEMGRAVLMVYGKTHEAKYKQAAEFLHRQLALQPRNTSGGYWHKAIYPNQMWLDGAYMAEPFRALYATTFHDAADWNDIAKQFALMDEHMRDPRTGLLRHGWDESKQMPWADKTTGLSPEVWGRAMGWYVVALADTLDWFPQDHPQRVKLVEILRRTLQAVVHLQDPETGLWWQVMSQGPEYGTSPDGTPRVLKPAREGNYPEASASAMFTYALAKSVRKGYLPASYGDSAEKGWDGLVTRFVTTAPDGTLALHGTVKVGGLGGKPYRSGDFEYYAHEPVGDQDAKGVGAFLMAGSEISRLSPTRSPRAAE